MSGELIRKDSIDELCGHRARALDLYALAENTLREARAAHARACPGQSYINQVDTALLRDWSDHRNRFAREARLVVDRDMWRAFLLNLGLGALMDAEEKRKFEHDLGTDGVPEATPDNVFATMSRLAGDADKIFRRGLVNAFARLSRAYSSNDGFKIGDRIVMSWVVVYERNCDWLRTGSNAEEALRDVDRVMRVLDGKATPDYQQGISAALRTAVQGWRTGGMECETEYWRLRFFKNGNGHLYPKRPDLIRRANLLIAEHFGEALGVGPKAAKGNTRQPAPAPEERECFERGFFPTPADVAQRVLDLAELDPGHVVLEPSAGTGSLLAGVDHAPFVTCCEIDPFRAAECKAKLAQLDPEIVVGDFLDWPKNPLFDRVVMNPPFAQSQDVLHVLHAWSLLAPGGRLVAVMSRGWLGRGDARSAELRRLRAEVEGVVEDLAPGSFRESGTMVPACILVLDKPMQDTAGHVAAEAQACLF